MGLYNTAYLVCQESPLVDNPRTAVFELRHVQEFNTTQEPSYIMGGQGEFLRQAGRYISDEDTFEIEETNMPKRAGFWLDGGTGRWETQLSFEAGIANDSITWGNGDGGEGQANVTQTDASGADVKPLARQQVLDFWLAMTRSDSFAHTRLHVGEWTDGSFDDYRDGEYVDVDAGAYGSPYPIAITSTNFEKGEETSYFTGTITGARVALFPASEALLADWTDAWQRAHPPLTPVPGP